MVTTQLARFPVLVNARRGEQELPAPVSLRTRDFSIECPGQCRPHNATTQIALKPLSGTIDLYPERPHGQSRQGNTAILVAFPRSHQNLAAIKIDVLDAQTRTLG